jgi:hypothetical protein
MDPVLNPFAPGAGSPPPELAGRADVLELAQTALRRLSVGRPIQQLILVGLRGVGKTVLLVKIRSMAEEEGFAIVTAEATEGKSLAALLAPELRKVLLSLSLIESAKDRVQRAVGVLKAFAGGFGFSIGEVALTYDPSVGVADSGDIEADLPDMLLELAAAAAAAKRPVLIVIDELQVLRPAEFSALIMAIHKINQKSLPVAFIGAGLPQVLGLAGNAKSYSERLFTFPVIGALTEEHAVDAIMTPAKLEGVKFEPDAIAEILNVTQRYPYFLQQWAHDAWNCAQGETITWSDVLDASETTTTALDKNFFRVRFDRCNQAEKIYMRALAELGSGNKRCSDVADILGVKAEKVAPHRASLIKKGMIFAPALAEICFTVPLFDAFMKRAIPTLDTRSSDA